EVRLAEPARDLTAVRMHDLVRLAWVWPDDEAAAAEVRWPGGEHRCSRRVYDDEGGVTVSPGPAQARIEGRLVYPHPGPPRTGPWPGRAAGPRARGQPAGAASGARRRRGRSARKRIIERAAEQAASLPARLVVRPPGGSPPDAPGGGRRVARVPPQPIAPD